MIVHLASDDALAILTTKDDRCQSDLHLIDQKAQCVAVDPLRPELVYCGTFGNGLWRSDDAGRNWRPAGDGIIHSKVFSVAVSRSERIGKCGVVYCGTEPSAVFRSEDGGKTWNECKGLMELPSSSEWSFPPRPQTHHARWIHPDPHLRGQLYVAIEAGALLHSPDGGNTWFDRVPTGPIDTHQLATHHSAPGRLYSAAGDGYFESEDGGQTWRHVEAGLAHRYVWSVAVDTGDPETRVVASAASPRRSHNEQHAESYIYRRTANTQWQQVHHGLPSPTGRRTAILAAHPQHAGTFIAVWESDLFRSTDAGASWQQIKVQWPDGFYVGEPRGLSLVS